MPDFSISGVGSADSLFGGKPKTKKKLQEHISTAQKLAMNSIHVAAQQNVNQTACGGHS